MSEWYPSASAPKSSLTRSPRAELPVRQVVVGFGRVVAERDDRVERAILGAGLDHRPFEDLGERALRHALAQAAAKDDGLERPVGEALRAIDRRDLLGVLDPAQAFDLGTDRHELQALRPIRELFPRLVGERVPLEPHARGAERSARVDEGLRVVLPVDGPRQVGHLVAGLRPVPAVGQEHRRRVRRDHELRVRPREAGQVAHVGQARDDQRLELRLAEALGEPGAPQPVIHGSASSATWYPPAPAPAIVALHAGEITECRRNSSRA